MGLGLPPEKNPVVPKDNESILIGVVGISEQRYFWNDNPKGRDSALAWLSEGSHPKRLFRVFFDGVTELEIVPPIPATLREISA